MLRLRYTSPEVVGKAAINRSFDFTCEIVISTLWAIRVQEVGRSNTGPRLFYLKPEVSVHASNLQILLSKTALWYGTWI